MKIHKKLMKLYLDKCLVLIRGSTVHTQKIHFKDMMSRVRAKASQNRLVAENELDLISL